MYGSKNNFSEMLTIKQKKAVSLLLAGGFIGGNGQHRIIVFDQRRNPVMRIHVKAFAALIPFCKKNDKRRREYIISIAAIRRQRKNSFVKKYYQSLKK